MVRVVVQFEPLAAALARDDPPALVLEKARGRIGSDAHRAWVTLASAHSLPAANGRRGPLSGVAVGVKDIIDVAGMPTRCGSEITPREAVPRSAAYVERLISLGAVPVGKTVTTEFAYFRPGPTDNPRAPGHTPGGSSSGSAAAVAAGHVPLALGTQTAGSLTRPAAYCGVAGLTLAHGSADLEGISGLSSSLDTVGLIAPTVADLAHVHRVVHSGPDGRRATTVHVWTGSDLDHVSPDMAAALRRASGVLDEAGFDVREFTADAEVAALTADHALVMGYEAARERADLYAVRGRLSGPLRQLLESGRAVEDHEYAAAVTRTERSRVRLRHTFGGGSLVLGPAAPGAAPRGLSATGSPVMSRPWQLLGLAQLCVPGCLDDAGRPLGLQLVGESGAEGTLLTTGRILEMGLRAGTE